MFTPSSYSSTSVTLPPGGCSLDFSITSTKSASFVVAPISRRESPNSSIFYAFEVVFDEQDSLVSGGVSGIRRIVGSTATSLWNCIVMDSTKTLKHKDGINSNKLRFSIYFSGEDQDNQVFVEVRPRETSDDNNSNDNDEKWSFKATYAYDSVFDEMKRNGMEVFFASKSSHASNENDDDSLTLLWNVESIGPAPRLSSNNNNDNNSARSTTGNQHFTESDFRGFPSCQQQQQVPFAATTLMMVGGQPLSFRHYFGQNYNNCATNTNNNNSNVLAVHHYLHQGSGNTTMMNFFPQQQQQSCSFQQQRQHFSAQDFAGMPTQIPTSNEILREQRQQQHFTSEDYQGMPTQFAAATSQELQQQQHFTNQHFAGMPSNIPATTSTAERIQHFSPSDYRGMPTTAIPVSTSTSTSNQQQQEDTSMSFESEPAFVVDESHIVTATLVPENQNQQPSGSSCTDDDFVHV